jgi:hypothetical protein
MDLSSEYSYVLLLLLLLLLMMMMMMHVKEISYDNRR